MSNSSLQAAKFEDRLSRLRAGDSIEIGNFVATYEPFLRRAIRFRLRRSGLQSVADSVDICQSVFSGFLPRLISGDYELKDEEDLQRLLLAITTKKFLMLLRHEHAEMRSRQRTCSLGEMSDFPAAEDSCQIGIDATAELVEAAIERLLPEELLLFEMRRQGKSWNLIGQELNEDSSKLRQRLSRAIRRVSLELGNKDGLQREIDR